jgi:hypothetical protein
MRVAQSSEVEVACSDRIHGSRVKGRSAHSCLGRGGVMFIPNEQEENVTNKQAGTQRSVARSPWIGQEPEKTWL